MAEKSKILIIGATGYIGKFIVEASAKAGHSTFALVRGSAASNPEKSKLIESFKGHGVTIIYVCIYYLTCLKNSCDSWTLSKVLLHWKIPWQGDIYDHESLVKAIKQVDVVISTVGFQQLGDQVKIIAAIKEAGTVKASTIVA